MNITLHTLFELSDALQVHPRDLFEFEEGLTGGKTADHVES